MGRLHAAASASQRQCVDANPYAYVQNNQVNYVDPTGEFAFLAALGITVAASTIFGWDLFVDQGYGRGGHNAIVDSWNPLDYWGQAATEGDILRATWEGTKAGATAATLLYGGPITWNARAALGGFLLGSGVANWRKGNSVFKDWTLKNIELATWSGVAFGVTNNFIAGTVMGPSSALVIENGLIPGTAGYQAVSAAAHAYGGFVVTFFIDVAVDGKPDDLGAMLASPLNATSVISYPFLGPFLTVFSYGVSAAVSDEGNQ